MTPEHIKLDAAIAEISDFGDRMYDAVSEPFWGDRARYVRELKIQRGRNSYDMIFLAPLPAVTLRNYRSAIGTSSFNEVVILYLGTNAYMKDKTLEAENRFKHGRNHTDQPDTAEFIMTALANNTRSTVHPVKKAAVEYAKAYDKAKGGTSKQIRDACGDTFFRLRRKMGPNGQFESCILNRGDQLIGQMNQPHRAPPCAGGDGTELPVPLMSSFPCL